MPRPFRYNPYPRPLLTPRSETSRVEIEALPDGTFAYRINSGPWRVVPPAPYGLHNTLRQLNALIDMEPRKAQEAAELGRIERELHEDILEYERNLMEHEQARLYSDSYMPFHAREPLAPAFCSRGVQQR